MRKVVGWVVDKSHNIVEHDNGFTSTPTKLRPHPKINIKMGFMLHKQKALKRMDNPS
jgi:hypothetical protein